MMGATRSRADCINLYETGITAQRKVTAYDGALRLKAVPGGATALPSGPAAGT